MKIELSPSFILHRRLYRETSLLLDVFSREHGRISLVANGVRKKGSNKSELLQIHQPLLLTWSGKGELMNLVAVEADGMAYRLAGNWLIAGFYINELIIRLLHLHEAHPELFDIYRQTLESLSNHEMGEQVILRVFEKRLMESVGYGMSIVHEAGSVKDIDPGIIYYYQAENGASSSVPAMGDYVKVSGNALISLANESFETQEVLTEIKKLMRYVLNKHLDGKQLASRNLYKSFINQSR